jgi:hypothetical protein
VAVTNRNGEIDLNLPQGAAFEIDAVAKNGRVISEYLGLRSSQNNNENEILKGKLGSAGPKILLNTENSDIHIRARENKDIRVPSEK